MDELLTQLFGIDFYIVVALPLYAGTAQINGLRGAKLQTTETLDAVCAYAGPAVFNADVALRAELYALAAAYALRVYTHFGGLFRAELAPGLGLKHIKGICGRCKFPEFLCQHILCHLLCQFFRPLL